LSVSANWGEDKLTTYTNYYKDARNILANFSDGVYWYSSAERNRSSNISGR